MTFTDGIDLAPGADDEAITRLRGLSSPFTLSQSRQARQALDTTRRVAVPIMELLARRGITHQLPNGVPWRRAVSSRSWRLGAHRDGRRA